MKRAKMLIKVKQKIDERILILTDARDNEFRHKIDIDKAQYAITQLRILKSYVQGLRHGDDHR